MPRRAMLLRGAALFGLAGCSRFGPQQLEADQMGYVNALGDGLKRQMLLNVVRLRYGDVPTFLSVSQLISGYTTHTSGEAGLNAFPNARPGNFITLSGTVEYTTRPTYTFTPVTGERFAQAYLRPLEPAQLLSLMQSGAPIDLLFRLGVQSINGLANPSAGALGRDSGPDRFETLIQALTELQSLGALSLRFENRATINRVFLLLGRATPGQSEAIGTVRRLLGLAAGVQEFELVYGPRVGGPARVGIITRSLLQVLYDIGNQIAVSEADIRSGATSAAVRQVRLVGIQQGSRAPSDAYTAVLYRDRWFWVGFEDYRSKITFSIVFALQVLAESGPGAAPLTVTIPAQ